MSSTRGSRTDSSPSLKYSAGVSLRPVDQRSSGSSCGSIASLALPGDRTSQGLTLGDALLALGGREQAGCAGEGLAGVRVHALPGSGALAKLQEGLAGAAQGAGALDCAHDATIDRCN